MLLCTPSPRRDVPELWAAVAISVGRSGGETGTELGWKLAQVLFEGLGQQVPKAMFVK